MVTAWVLVVVGSLLGAEGVDGGSPELPPPVPVAIEPEAPPAVRAFVVYSPGLLVSFPGTAQGSYRDWRVGGFVTGTGQRSTPTIGVPLLVDLELGVVIHDRYRVSVQGVPVCQLLGHVGYDVVQAPLSNPGSSATITLWVGGGYEHVLMVSNGPHLYGGVSSVRATFEFKWGVFILRPEVFLRLQFVTRYDEENDGEGRYMTYSSPALTFQAGVKLGLGINWRL